MATGLRVSSKPIDFAIYALANATLRVFEGGTYAGIFGYYAAGDRLRVSVEGGVVKYKRNGVVIYTSTQAPQYPLLADTSLYSTGATIQNAVISGTLQSSGLNSPPIPRDGLSSVSYDGTSNRITTSGYSYDAAGNQIRVVHADTSVQKYQYDAAGRMVKVRNANGVVLATYTYGASNQRLVSQAGDEQSSYRTYYAWGGDAVVAEYSENPSQPTSPQWTKSYVYLGARLLATLTPSGTSSELIQYHHPDRLGTRLVTNAQDTNSFEQVSLPFGTALDAESSGATNRRFTSYDRSTVTGLDYAVNRHYDAQQGRFTQVDPIGAGASSLVDPQSWNLYAYVGNDPINRVDPDGLFWGKLFKWIGKIVKAITVVAAVVAIFVGILATAGVLAPIAGVAFGLKLFAAAAIGLAGAFGPPWLQKAISIGSLAFGFLSGAGVFGFAEGGGGVSWGRAATAFGILQGVGAVANHLQRGDRRRRSGRAVALSGRLLAAFNLARGIALKLLDDPTSDCAKFLAAHGFDPRTVSQNLRSHIPYDLLRSSNKDSFGLLNLKNLQSIQPNAATSDSGNTYYTRKGLTTPISIHETLHRLDPKLSDLDLAQRLGISEQVYISSGQGSTIIDRALEEGGCK